MQIFAVRGLRAITFVSEFPYRKVQIVLRLYKTLAEVLHGFDVDACSMGFDGHTVSAIISTRRYGFGRTVNIRQCNLNAAVLSGITEAFVSHDPVAFWRDSFL